MRLRWFEDRPPKPPLTPHVLIAWGYSYNSILCGWWYQVVGGHPHPEDRRLFAYKRDAKHAARAEHPGVPITSLPKFPRHDR